MTPPPLIFFFLNSALFFMFSAEDQLLEKWAIYLTVIMWHPAKYQTLSHATAQRVRILYTTLALSLVTCHFDVQK